MTEATPDAFDHTRFREEVEQRWGAQAYARSDRWWRRMSEAEREQWQAVSQQLADDLIAAAAPGVAPDSPAALVRDTLLISIDERSGERSV